MTLKTGAFTAPTWHGPWLVVPENWTGPVPATALFTGPSISWPPSPLPAPNLGTGWSGSLGRGYPDTELEGIYSHTDGGFLDVYIFQLGRWPIAVYRLSTTYAAAGRIHEFRVIDGRYAHLSYDRLRSGTSQATVVIYDDATGLVYTVRGGPKSRNNDPEATIDLARKFILPPAGPPPTSFRYHRYDTNGEVAEPGSYAFLADPADTASAVTTYEALRDGTTTALRIHQTDADGVSRAAFLDTVEVGDLFEWREAEDCWVRYMVTEVLPDPSGTPRRLLGVEWVTYAFTGCSGAVSAEAAVTVDWGELPDLGGVSLTAPVVHGIYQIVPAGWEGGTKEKGYVYPPRYSEPAYTEDITVARTYEFWREPTVPEDWEFSGAWRDGGDSRDGVTYGYCAEWRAGARTLPGSTRLIRPGGIVLCAHFSVSRFGQWTAGWIYEDEGAAYEAAHETRVIAGRPARFLYSPPGPDFDDYFPISIEVFNPETEVTYEIEVIDDKLKENPDAVLELARSLFESANPQ